MLLSRIPPPCPALCLSPGSSLDSASGEPWREHKGEGRGRADGPSDGPIPARHQRPLLLEGGPLPRTLPSECPSVAGRQWLGYCAALQRRPDRYTLNGGSLAAGPSSHCTHSGWSESRALKGSSRHPSTYRIHLVHHTDTSMCEMGAGPPGPQRALCRGSLRRVRQVRGTSAAAGPSFSPSSPPD